MIEMTISGRAKDLGGFAVRRLIPVAKRRLVGPFIFFDHIGPAEFEPGTGIDVRPHPHIGLATVTYLFDGEMDHRDTLGVHKTIKPGDVNWMTAGRGIVHSERTGDTARAAGHKLHGIQTWVALPTGDEETDPFFSHHASGELPEIEMDGVKMRLILGSAYGKTSPVKVFSPIFYLHVESDAGSVFKLTDEHEERAVYVVSGEIEIDGRLFGEGEMIVLDDEASIGIRTVKSACVMICGGAKLAGDRHIFWNFVSSSKDRLEKAKADWKASADAGFENSAFALPPGETEHIPLPES
ncbi:pirin family protein [Hyphobacterium sp. CCMP332]|jgi:redox-sensitive bicupin YhaK (pirin superfamily)|uniref:pirin family protein n=1 Tax=Hyphobacterium sp. CCMP332 TaxID=2749086 RepID=UPI00164EE193|nr:pirin family protein [Hyphobacterium sp. CCMP332]QNL18458.1 pirin family protein [Hyphobacterium sp. CCMP332]